MVLDKYYIIWYALCSMKINRRLQDYNLRDESWLSWYAPINEIEARRELNEIIKFENEVKRELEEEVI